MRRLLLIPFVAIAVVGLAAGGQEVGAGSPSGSLPFFYDLYAFRGDAGATDVVASFAVQAGRLDRERVDGRVQYRFNVTLVLADTARGGVFRADDSVFVAFDRSVDGDHLLHAHVETRARPATSTAMRVVMIDAPDPGTGQMYQRGFRVPDFTGDTLMLSDLALGLPERSGGWRRGDQTLTLLPANFFPGGLFDVYYEVYNLPRGDRYTTEMALEAVDATGRPEEGEEPIRVRFVDESIAGPDGTLPELRRVDAPLDRGRYRMTVTVTNQATGRSARRARFLEVREWEEGSTLVSTCPIRAGASAECRE